MDIDYYSIDSETIETLNILRPPVKRICKNTRRDLINYLIGDSDKINVARDIDTIYKAEKKKTCKHIKHTVESSLSLVLQKTCKREIFEKYSLLNNNTNHIEKTHSHNIASSPEETPLIRVSVIPKAEREPLNNELESNKNTTRGLRKSASKDENSIQTKNLYLVVAGKREKIYEIKTTGSAKAFRDSKTEDVKELFINKRKSKFSNMERKKKKPDRQEEDEYPNFNFMPCPCKCTEQNSTQDALHPGSSRVKIVGRIGRNENDKYVMKCAATVNGLPVSTIGAEEENNIFYHSLVNDGKTYLEKTKESQGTQVDNYIAIPSSHPTCDQKVQCNACDVCVESNCCENSRTIRLKETSSPLVIISVYPKQETNNIAVNTKPSMSAAERSFLQNYGLRQTKTENMRVMDAYTVNTDAYPTLETSLNIRNIPRNQPSDTDNNDDVRVKTYQNNEPFETSKNDNIRRKKTISTRTYRASRSASPVNRSPKSIMQERKTKIATEAKLGRSDVKNKSPKQISIIEKREQSLVDIHKRSKNVSTNKNTEVRKQRIAESRRSRDKSVNTDGAQINNTFEGRYSKKARKNKGKINKKDILNDIQKPLHSDTLIKKTLPQNNISKVSVNIDSEKEYYDVIFEKGKFNTDLIVRQTMKENSSQKYFEQQFDNDFDEYFNENRASDSLENYFPMEPAGRHRRSVSQAFSNYHTDGIPFLEQASRLNVRDSLEINHRRDEKDMKTQAHEGVFEYDSTEENDEDYFAPIKHYTGDNCTISDPIERDKEIRELLGVNKTRTADDGDEGISKTKHSVSRSHPMSSHNLFQQTLRETSTAKLILQQSCSCSSCTRREILPASEVQFRNISKELVVNNCINKKKQGPFIAELETKYRKQEKEDNAATKTKDQGFVYNSNKIPRMINETTQYETLEKSLKNHNITDFLNVEQCLKRKAILLSRIQYNKVKKTIRKVSRKRQSKKTWKSSIVSIGDVKAKTKSEYLMHWNKEVQTDPTQALNRNEKFRNIKLEAGDTEKNTLVLFTRHNEDMDIEKKGKEVRKVTSSVEIRYTSIAYVEDPPGSITNVGSLGSSNLEKKRHLSVQTLFRGHRKTRTPNLGASALSLLTEKSMSQSEKSLSDLRQKKPFLRRLMSCLVMRAGRSAVKIDSTPKHKAPTMNSSYDSYHISTSLAAIEMSSSLYDTSMSFYSSHTIGPINNKMKRGFFSSVRGFLTTRRS